MEKLIAPVFALMSMTKKNRIIKIYRNAIK